MGENKQLGMLDIMSMISFFISVANYSENLGQSSTQDVITNFVHDIHKHLQQQDEKIDKILSMLEGSEEH